MTALFLRSVAAAVCFGFSRGEAQVQFCPSLDLREVYACLPVMRNEVSSDSLRFLPVGLELDEKYHTVIVRLTNRRATHLKNQM